MPETDWVSKVTSLLPMALTGRGEESQARSNSPDANPVLRDIVLQQVALDRQPLASDNLQPHAVGTLTGVVVGFYRFPREIGVMAPQPEFVVHRGRSAGNFHGPACVIVLNNDAPLAFSRQFSDEHVEVLAGDRVVANRDGRQ